MKIAISCLIFTAMFSVLVMQDEPQAEKELATDRPIELGRVNWRRDLDTVKKKSADTGKPILMLFQEIPGCQTCQNFGSSPMSHPLMVEAIEDLFVPVLVYNNKKEDEATLKQFQEPSWNNPVIRYLDSNAKDLIERKDNIWTTSGTASRMIAALKAAGKPAPKFLGLVAAMDEKAKIETAEFAMHCYWEGEAKLGSIGGVKATRSGWRDKLEVVQIEFDPALVDYDKLLETAQSFDCASRVFTHNENQQSAASMAVGKDAIPVKEKMRDAKLSDQKYYLRNSVYAHLPLTSLQATRINAALFLKQAPDQWLSRRQAEMLRLILAAKQKDKNAFADCVWPDDDTKLVAYQDRLKAQIAKQVAVWNPAQRVTMALAGDFDLDEDGKSDRQQLIELIEKNGGQVVAQHDEKGNIIGEIDASTRYLVMGNILDGSNDARNAAIRKLLDQAKSNSVQQIECGRLLKWLGVNGQGKIERLDGKIGDEFRKRTPAQSLKSPKSHGQ